MNPETEPMALEVVAEPTALMRRATDVAGVCREIVLRTACNIQGKKYVKCEGWQSIATAHGCIASSRDVQRVEGGWTAIGEIRRISDGVVLSTAEGFVGKDEKRWSSADEYACRAMVQTRAISRACRAAFAYVVVMMDAGLSTTPAEEVPEGGFENAKPVPRGTDDVPMKFDKPAPAKAKTADVTGDPEKWLHNCKEKLLSSLKPHSFALWSYAQAVGWILPTETVADIPAHKMFPGVDLKKGICDENMAAAKEDQVRCVSSVEILADHPDKLEGRAEFEKLHPTAAPPPPIGRNEDQDRVIGTIVAISSKSGKSAKGPWTRYGIKIGEDWYSTFSDTLAKQAEEAKASKREVVAHYDENEHGRNLVALE
jgi:hypothetical protein